MAEYQTSSPYFSTPISRENLGVMVDRPIPRLVDDIEYTITKTYERRPDLLANDLYQDPGLWWVFAQRNPNTLVDPINDFVADTTIYLPQLATLKTALGI